MKRLPMIERKRTHILKYVNSITTSNGFYYYQILIDRVNKQNSESAYRCISQSNPTSNGQKPFHSSKYVKMMNLTVGHIQTHIHVGVRSPKWLVFDLISAEQTNKFHGHTRGNSNCSLSSITKMERSSFPSFVHDLINGRGKKAKN